MGKTKVDLGKYAIENRISLKFINSKQGAIDSLFKQLYDHVKESFNEMIPITLIIKVLHLKKKLTPPQGQQNQVYSSFHFSTIIDQSSYEFNLYFSTN